MAKYTSALARKKAGVLQVYDKALYSLILGSSVPLHQEKKHALTRDGVAGVKQLRLYEVIIATAMCMVIGEWQKRETVIAIILALIDGGNGASG